jgi:hypothetical protein
MMRFTFYIMLYIFVLEGRDHMENLEVDGKLILE